MANWFSSLFGGGGGSAFTGDPASTPGVRGGAGTFEGPYQGSGENSGPDATDNYLRGQLSTLGNNPPIVQTPSGRFERVQVGTEEVTSTDVTQDVRFALAARARNEQLNAAAMRGDTGTAQVSWLDDTGWLKGASQGASQGGRFQDYAQIGHAMMAQQAAQQQQPPQGSLQLGSSNLSQGFDPNWLNSQITAGSAMGQAIGGGGGGGGMGGGGAKKQNSGSGSANEFASYGGGESAGWAGGGAF